MDKISISGFKCFIDTTFDIKDITVLSGSNGTGKSSVIQSILLARLAIEKNALLHKDTDYDLSQWKGYEVPLNLGYELALGTVDDIFNKSSLEKLEIIIQLANDIFVVPLPEDKENNTSVLVKYSKNAESLISQSDFWLKREFYYLNAERLGPRQSLLSNFTEFLHCGYKGEYTAQVLLNNSFFRVKEKRLFGSNIKSEYLPQQIDAWLDYVCPGTSVKVEPLGKMSAQIMLRNNSIKNHVLATNIGFGISYALPIIVTGLIAEEGTVVIIENPEAHLHPKGQSNMGFFLGKVAASGIKVIIETHSEHVINGIRRAALTADILATDNVSIYFFNGSDLKNSIIPITIQTNGDLSDFPLDFFDQTRQDLLEILKLSRR